MKTTKLKPFKSMREIQIILVFTLLSIMAIARENQNANLESRYSFVILSDPNHHKSITLPNDLNVSTRLKLQTSIEKKLITEINRTLKKISPNLSQ